MDFALTASIATPGMGGFPGSLPPCVFTTSGERGGGGKGEGQEWKGEGNSQGDAYSCAQTPPHPAHTGGRDLVS